LLARGRTANSIRIYFQPMGTAPEALRILMREEADRWGKVIKAAGVKPG
jgi:hypothetical protein